MEKRLLLKEPLPVLVKQKGAWVYFLIRIDFFIFAGTIKRKLINAREESFIKPTTTIIEKSEKEQNKTSGFYSTGGFLCRE